MSKKYNSMFTLSKKIFCGIYCKANFKVLISDDASQFNDAEWGVRIESITHLLKDQEHSKHSSSTERAVANKFVTKYKKQCRMLQSPRQNKNNMSNKSQLPNINYLHLTDFSNFLF